MPSAIALASAKLKNRKEDAIMSDQIDTTPPNNEYLVLTRTRIDATYKSGSGKNETVYLEREKDRVSGELLETFLVKRGNTGCRWNNREKVQRYPMEQWNSIYSSFLFQGYILYDTEKREMVKTVGSSLGYAPLSDDYVASLVERLHAFANKMIEETYQKSIMDVPDWAFEKAKEILDDLALNYENMSNEDFNNKLISMFQVLPRRIDIMAKYIVKDDAVAEDRAKKIEEERDRYDVLHTMLRGGSVDLTGKETILEAYGLEIRKFTDEEWDYAKKLLKHNSGRLINGWRVVNKRTEKAFEEFCKKESLTEKKGIDFLFHGSRSENWWSIISNGLTINPVGVVITGKAYGQGTYFAPDAQKSLGYTSRVGAKWTQGGQSTGFMAIYKVATGNRYDGHKGCDSRLNWEKLQQIQPGAHCTWAECRWSGFMMDEVIVYKDCQSTIWGLLELGM